jgi:peptide/nickel transport system substrate-binding protein
MKRGLALLPCILVLGACARPPAPTSSSLVDRPLRIVLGVEPTTLDPHVPFDDVSSAVLDNVFDSLVRFDRSLRLTSSLALRWINPDDRTWRFFLDPEARFPDGTALTAADVKFSLERVRSLAGSQLMGLARHIVSASVVDDHTIDLHTDTPIAILNSLAFIPIASERYVTAAGAQVGEQPFGTGPYRLVRWERGKTIVLEANEHYKPRPAIRRVEFLFAKDEAAVLQALTTLKPDLGALLRWSLREELEKRLSGDQRIVAADGLGVFYLQLNVRPHVAGRPGRNPLQDRRVRRALALATDIAELVREGIHGTGHPATQLVAPQVFGFDPSIPATAYDPEAARKLLAEAGTPSLEVPILAQQRRVHGVEEILIRQWSRAGVKGVLKTLPDAAYQTALDTGAFSAALQGFACSSADASEILTSAFHSPAPGRGDGAFNYGGFSNAEIDSIADENLKVFDPRRRLEMLQRSLVPLFDSDDLDLISRQLRWEPPVTGIVDVAEMSFAMAPASR